MKKNGEIISNIQVKGLYYHVSFYHPEIAQKAQPGQFVHVRIAQNEAHLLRRPFSIFDTNPSAGTVDVVYKVVGSGTSVLSNLPPGVVCDLLGPLGVPFSIPSPTQRPVMITGGFGSAATYLLAKRSAQKGILLLGARTEADVILTEYYEALGVDVRIATEDGSLGIQGRVTDLLEPIFAEQNPAYTYGACGPQGMLMAVGRMALSAGYPAAELSLDHPMCCGVGACFACVLKVVDTSGLFADGWRYARSCSEGPVFRSDAIYYE